MKQDIPGPRRPAKRFCCWLFAVLLLIVACVEPSDETALPSATAGGQPDGPTATAFVLPTLYPTATRLAPRSTATPPSQATATPGPTVDLTQKVVEFRYRIPALGLDRRLEGEVSGTITVVDETTGLAAILRNQGGVLLELQQALPDLALAPVPDECERCVHFSYTLPLAGESAEGWLQDPVMLASAENYLTTTLGPHFPPGTVIGLHRTATPYDVAQSLALTADGTLWRWLATSGEIAAAEPAPEGGAGLRALSLELEPENLGEEYVINCPGAPVERLLLSPELLPPAAEGEGEETPVVQVGEQVEIRVVCPAFSLPVSLLPLYARLDALLAERAVEQAFPEPPPAIPLRTLIAYEQQEGPNLLLLQGGDLQAVTAGGDVYTGTLTAGEVLSLTVSLQESEALEAGVAAYAEGSAAHSLLVRGPEGMREAVWEEAPADALQEPVAALKQLLEALVGIEPEVTGTPQAGGTLTATATLTTTVTPRATTVP